MCSDLTVKYLGKIGMRKNINNLENGPLNLQNMKTAVSVLLSQLMRINEKCNISRAA